MDKYGDLCPQENYVGSPIHAGERAQIDPITKAEFEEFATQQEFRLRVTPLIALHRSAYRGTRSTWSALHEPSISLLRPAYADTAHLPPPLTLSAALKISQSNGTRIQASKTDFRAFIV